MSTNVYPNDNYQRLTSQVPGGPVQSPVSPINGRGSFADYVGYPRQSEVRAATTVAVEYKVGEDVEAVTNVDEVTNLGAPAIWARAKVEGLNPYKVRFDHYKEKLFIRRYGGHLRKLEVEPGVEINDTSVAVEQRAQTQARLSGVEHHQPPPPQQFHGNPPPPQPVGCWEGCWKAAGPCCPFIMLVIIFMMVGGIGHHVGRMEHMMMHRHHHGPVGRANVVFFADSASVTDLSPMVQDFNDFFGEDNVVLSEDASELTYSQGDQFFQITKNGGFSLKNRVSALTGMSTIKLNNIKFDPVTRIVELNADELSYQVKFENQDQDQGWWGHGHHGDSSSSEDHHGHGHHGHGRRKRRKMFR